MDDADLARCRTALGAAGTAAVSPRTTPPSVPAHSGSSFDVPVACRRRGVGVAARGRGQRDKGIKQLADLRACRGITRRRVITAKFSSRASVGSRLATASISGCSRIGVPFDVGMTRSGRLPVRVSFREMGCTRALK
jgi:hypothetical protein